MTGWNTAIPLKRETAKSNIHPPILKQELDSLMINKIIYNHLDMAIAVITGVHPVNNTSLVYLLFFAM